MGETPGSIPNPEAKAHSADGTAAGRLWESRSPPDILWGRASHCWCEALPAFLDCFPRKDGLPQAPGTSLVS